jgi:RNA polymerase sigma factor (sigma-70 family)
MTDAHALSEFVRTRSDEAFAAVVRRYVDLIYSVARRCVGGDAHLAQDVTQAAFIVLASKADRVDPRTLPGWLVNTTRLTALQAMRAQRRRHYHEARAGEMRRETSSPPEEPTAEELTPLLDEALSTLGETDRAAVVMRFLRGQSFADVGAALGTTEDAARKRVARALDKLRHAFMKRGLAPSVGGLIIALASQQARAAPAHLAGSITTPAASGGAPASLAGAVMTTMKWTAIKPAIVGSLAAVLVVGIGLGTWTAGRTQAGAPAGPAARAPATAPAPAAAPAKGIVAALNNGVSVELLGLVRGWVVEAAWLPDGTPDPRPVIAKGRYERTIKVGAPEDHPSKQAVGVVVRFRLKTNDGQEASETFGPWHTTALDARGEPIEDVLIIYGITQDDTDKADLRFQIASGPWEQTGVRATAAELGRRKGPAHLSAAKPLRGGTHVELMAPPDRWAELLGRGIFRLSALDSSGRVRVAIPFQPRSVAADGAVLQISGFHFPDAEPHELIDFWVERRTPNQWVEFKNVACKPNQKTNVQVLTSDSRRANEKGSSTDESKSANR